MTHYYVNNYFMKVLTPSGKKKGQRFNLWFKELTYNITATHSNYNLITMMMLLTMTSHCNEKTDGVDKILYYCKLKYSE